MVENVKVYCGANSKRSLNSVDGQRIITFDFVMKDKNRTSDRKMEAERLVILVCKRLVILVSSL